jgi:two-component system, NtrC family, response regulator HydG
VPSLVLYALSDSFSAIWPNLAAELELELVIQAEGETPIDPADAVQVVVGAGVEHEMEAVLRGLPGSGGAVAAVGALPDHRLAVRLVHAGAAEYFALPQDYESLRSWLSERAARLRSRAERSAFAAGESIKYRFEGILGESAALRSALDKASRVIPHPNVTVLITGETGTGKELLARAIHYNGPRSEAPFVDLNCAAIPEHLLESELFGHEKGAFTGAGSAKPGLFELAHGGTLFLDEIGHLSPTLQSKLLRVLQERTVRRVGGSRSKPIDVRVVAATHVDLRAAVRSREFREDLYHRLNVVTIELPPLRSRPGDVPLLTRRFLSHFAREYGVREPELTAAAELAMAAHPWSGNIRELRNALERAVLLCVGGVIEPEVLGLQADGPHGGGAGTLPFPSPLRTIVHAAAQGMLDLCGGNKSDAARRLGISRTRLQRLLEGSPDHDPGEDIP